METMTFTFEIINDDGSTSTRFHPSSGGAGTCHLVNKHANKENARLTVDIDRRGTIQPSWDKNCIRFRTKKKGQTLTIRLVTTHQHNGKPLFHFDHIETTRCDLVPKIDCYVGSGPTPDETVTCTGTFPEHTHKVDIHFDMSTIHGQGTPAFGVDLVVKRIDNGTTKNCDPQVGNEPPSDDEPGPPVI
ncbi:MAG: hypothetical protein E6Q88_04470 [Lysobacteraceae bacterium]|nr:MAG: hypothetical protein E6Q88_04470 [Xanthomonadaceae bacterium]